MNAITTNPHTMIRMHTLDHWLDHTGGTGITKCGIRVEYGSPSARRILDGCTWISCPLCEAAELLESIHTN